MISESQSTGGHFLILRKEAGVEHRLKNHDGKDEP